MALPAHKPPPRNTYWRDRTEQDLVDHEFTVTEPEKLVGISGEPPPPGEFIVEFAYDVSGRPQGRAQCVHCQYPNHNRGLVIRFADGSRRLVGKDCGRKLYGALFDDLHKDFKSARDHAASLKRRQRILAAETIISNGMETLRADRALKQFSNMAGRVRNVLGDSVVYELLATAKRGDALTVAEKVRDLAAEANASETLDPEHVAKLAQLNRTEQKRYRKRHNLPNPERYKWLNRSLGPVRGTALLYDFRLSADGHFAGLANEMGSCFGGLRQQRNWSSTGLSLAMQQINELIQRLERDIEKLRAPLEFFDYSHLTAICEWAKHQPMPIHLTCGMGWLERDGDYGAVRAEFSAGYEAPSTQFIESFRAAIEL